MATEGHGQCLTSLIYEDEANAACFKLEEIVDGIAVDNVVVEDPGRGDAPLDFDANGRLLGMAIIGATALLRATALDAAERLRPCASLRRLTPPAGGKECTGSCFD